MQIKICVENIDCDLLEIRAGTRMNLEKELQSVPLKRTNEL